MSRCLNLLDLLTEVCTISWLVPMGQLEEAMCKLLRRSFGFVYFTILSSQNLNLPLESCEVRDIIFHHISVLVSITITVIRYHFPKSFLHGENAHGQ